MSIHRPTPDETQAGKAGFREKGVGGAWLQSVQGQEVDTWLRLHGDLDTGRLGGMIGLHLTICEPSRALTTGQEGINRTEGNSLTGEAIQVADRTPLADR